MGSGAAARAAVNKPTSSRNKIAWTGQMVGRE